MARPILAPPAATGRVDAALERYIQRAEAAEVALGRAREALDDADFLIAAARELVDVFPGSDEEKQQAGGQLGRLARALEWLEIERAPEYVAPPEPERPCQ